MNRTRERALWAAALLATALFSGGVAYGAAETETAVSCPAGVSLEVKPDGTWACMTPSPNPTVTPSSSTSNTPTPAPSSSSSSPTGPRFPTASSVGIQIGWTPRSTFTGTMVIRTPGVYEDIRVNGSVEVRAQGVTLRRFDVVGGILDTEDAGRCYTTVVEDTTLRKTTTTDRVASNGAIGPGGYTARRVAILDRAEGFRIGGRSDANCGAVLIEDSYARIAKPSDISCTDWHGDGVQGFDAPTAIIRHSTVDVRNRADCGTAGVFYGSAEQWGNQALTVRGLLIVGGAVAYRPDTPHDTEGLRIVEGTYGAALGTDSSGNYTCRRATRWVDNAISDAAGVPVRPLTC